MWAAPDDNAWAQCISALPVKHVAPTSHAGVSSAWRLLFVVNPNATMLRNQETWVARLSGKDIVFSLFDSKQPLSGNEVLVNVPISMDEKKPMRLETVLSVLTTGRSPRFLGVSGPSAVVTHTSGDKFSLARKKPVYPQHEASNEPVDGTNPVAAAGEHGGTIGLVVAIVSGMAAALFIGAAV